MYRICQNIDVSPASPSDITSKQVTAAAGLEMDGFDINASDGPKIGDSELQDFLMMEKQKAQFNAQIHEFNDFCWEKCMDKPGGKLDSKTETCFTNCVERFLDVSFLITNRFAQFIQKSAAR